jgi:hypothetical protein
VWEPPPDDSGDSGKTPADKEIVMFNPIPAETPLRSHLDGGRRNHRHLQRIAEIRKQRRSDRPLR